MSRSLLTRSWLLAAILGATTLLAGCATAPRQITTEVQTYANMQGIALPSTYRLELLPSQTQQPSFAHIEAAAQNALQRVGLTRAEHSDQARLSVQIDASASQGLAYHPAYDGFYGPRFGVGIGFGPWGSMRWMDTPPVVYYRAVKLVMREQPSQRIVFETSAEYDEVRREDALIWGILFDAALSGFPNPPAGNRSVVTTLTPLPAPDSTPTTTPTPPPAPPAMQ